MSYSWGTYDGRNRMIRILRANRIALRVVLDVLVWACALVFAVLAR